MSATNRGAKRNESDYYPTPFGHIQAIMEHIANEYKLAGLPVRSFLEPCYGDRRVLRHAARYFPNCQKFYGFELSEGSDFLAARAPDIGHTVDLCITNPPFGKAEEFLYRIRRVTDTFCVLLRLNFLGGQRRHDNFWLAFDNMRPPDTLIVLPDRPKFIPGTGRTDATEYAWFCWWGERLCNAWIKADMSPPAAITWLRAPHVTVKDFYANTGNPIIEPWPTEPTL